MLLLARLLGGVSHLLGQVSFLHVYHHMSISVAWWAALKLYPGGDVYFGALINSWIHVMMYSYYTLSLLKIPCPWKKFLTMAQLIQFTTVVGYSLYAMSLPTNNYTSKEYLAHGIQIFEMTSLFVLFMGFYRKAYTKKPVAAKDTASDATVSEQDSLSSTSSDDGSDDQQ